MRVTVLGGCGAWPEAGRAASGFLVEHDGFVVALDLGYATLPNLLRVIPPERLDAVLITHAHPDHCADLHPLHRAWRMRADALPPLRVYCTDGVMARIEGLEGGEDVAELRETLDVRLLVPGGTFDLGPWRVSNRYLPHWVPNAGLRLDTGTASLAYTGDTGPSEEIVELARDASLLIADATWSGRPPGSTPRYNLTAAEAAGYAARAGAQALLLSHFWPGTDRARAVEAARACYDGAVRTADEGLTIDLPAG
ncbi:MAG TPA: MBL fold metallo-hydrolase [Streptosporangiaceae bacterium]|jgi:ribonuclease BN (tRNA processing enzyme)